MSLPTTDQIKQIITKTKAGYKSSALAVVNAVEEDLQGFVPNTTKVNNKPLNSDVNLTAGDVGALPEEDRACMTKFDLAVDLWNETEASVTNSLASTDPSYAFIVKPAPGDSLKAWDNYGVMANDPTDTAFTFSCKSKPEETITVQVLRIKASEV